MYTCIQLIWNLQIVIWLSAPVQPNERATQFKIKINFLIFAKRNAILFDFYHWNEFIHSASDSGNLDSKDLFFVETTSGHFQIISRLTVMVGFNIYSQNYKKFRDANQLQWNYI